jgi:hypothetical protein
MLGFFEFIKRVKKRLVRFARKTNNDVSASDLEASAWILASEIEARRGQEIDFSNPADEDYVLAALYTQEVNQGDWNLRNSVRFDQSTDNVDGDPMSWDNLLGTSEELDPQYILQALQEAQNIPEIGAVDFSYSEFTAYVVSLRNFDDNRDKLCSHLEIARRTLRERFQNAEIVVREQNSLFDRIERISQAFIPLPGKKYLAKIELSRSMEQWAWQF